MEADHRFWVNADDVQTPTIALEEASEEPEEDRSDLFILKHTAATFRSMFNLLYTDVRPYTCRYQSRLLTWILSAEGCVD